MTENPISDPEGGFDVRLHRSGRTIVVPPGETILDVLLDAGVNVSFSCTEDHDLLFQIEIAGVDARSLSNAGAGQYHNRRRIEPRAITISNPS